MHAGGDTAWRCPGWMATPACALRTTTGTTSRVTMRVRHTPAPQALSATGRQSWFLAPDCVTGGGCIYVVFPHYGLPAGDRAPPPPGRAKMAPCHFRQQ